MRTVLPLTLMAVLATPLHAQVVRAVGVASSQPAATYQQNQNEFGATIFYSSPSRQVAPPSGQPVQYPTVYGQYPTAYGQYPSQQAGTGVPPGSVATQGQAGTAPPGYPQTRAAQQQAARGQQSRRGQRADQRDVRDQDRNKRQQQLPVYIPDPATERFFRNLYGHRRSTFNQSQQGYTLQGLSRANQNTYGYSQYGQTRYGQSYSNPGFQNQSTYNQSQHNYSLHNVVVPGSNFWRY
jgi:hypothetical protein